LVICNNTESSSLAHKSSAPTNLSIVGRYILTYDIFLALENTQPDKNGEIQITDALLILAKQGKVIAYQFQGTRFDCGSVKGFVEANTLKQTSYL
jgi:UTP--glucose-1-phosphate uridylyltransferase